MHTLSWDSRTIGCGKQKNSMWKGRRNSILTPSCQVTNMWLALRLVSLKTIQQWMYSPVSAYSRPTNRLHNRDFSRPQSFISMNSTMWARCVSSQNEFSKVDSQTNHLFPMKERRGDEAMSMVMRRHKPPPFSSSIASPSAPQPLPRSLIGSVLLASLALVCRNRVTVFHPDGSLKWTAGNCNISILLRRVRGGRNVDVTPGGRLDLVPLRRKQRWMHMGTLKERVPPPASFYNLALCELTETLCIHTCSIFNMFLQYCITVCWFICPGGFLKKKAIITF